MDIVSNYQLKCLIVPINRYSFELYTPKYTPQFSSNLLKGMEHAEKKHPNKK
jgi:hypothetical protein